MKQLTYLLLLIPFLAFCQKAKLEKMLTELNETGFTGFALYDSEQNDYLFEYNADKSFIPASNSKIYTFYKTFNQIPDSLIAFSYEEINDTVFIQPFADPTFLYADFSSKNVDNLFNKTDKTIAVNFDYSVDKYANGWTWDDYDQEYMPERSVFPMYGNLKTEKNQNLFKANTSLKEKNREYLSNTFSKNSKNIPFITSDSLTILLLKDRYKKDFVIGKPKNIYYKNLNYLKNKLYSVSKKEVFQKMMYESDNFIAEQLPFQVKLIQGYKFSSQNIISSGNINDGSGLSRYNLTTPKSITTVLHLIQQNTSDYLDYFPENGISGNLQNSYKTESSYIFAKTGSMGGVYNLSGYLKTDSGKTLIFSLLNNNQAVKGSTLKPKMEEILLFIKHNY